MKTTTPGGPSHCVVRRATREHREALLQLVKALADYEKLAPPDAEAQARLMEDLFGPKPRVEAWIAEVGGAAAGYALTFETYSSFLALPTLYLEDLFVLPEYRKRRVGASLFRAMIEEAHRRGCGRMEWAVLTWNQRPSISMRASAPTASKTGSPTVWYAPTCEGFSQGVESGVPSAMKNLGILLSGRGSNFEAIARNVAAGKIPARIAVALSNREDAAGLARAREIGLLTQVVLSKGKDRETYDREVVEILRTHHVDVVCLAGFMRVLSPYFVRAFPGRILNIHPALLPAFPGLEAQKQALEYGVKFTGCTVHLVDEGVDTGPILCQAVVPVLDGDTVETLSERILREEHRIYSEAIRLVVEDRIRIEGRRVIANEGLSPLHETILKGP